MTYTIALFSDTHGRIDTMENAVDALPKENLTVIHLGDGAAEAKRLMDRHPESAFLGVRGNCDPLSGVPLSRTLDIGGVRIMFAHGHEFGVKSSLIGAARAAERAGAELFFYGHTHTAADTVCDLPDGKCIRMINPGAAVLGKWALAVIDNGEVSVRFYG